MFFRHQKKISTASNLPQIGGIFLGIFLFFSRDFFLFFGLASFSLRFPLVFLHFPYLSFVFRRFSLVFIVFPLVLVHFPHFSVVFHGFSLVFLVFSIVLPAFSSLSLGFPSGFRWLSLFFHWFCFVSLRFHWLYCIFIPSLCFLTLGYP